MKIIWHIRVTVFFIIIFILSFIAWFAGITTKVLSLSYKSRYNIGVFLAYLFVNFACKIILGLTYKVYGKELLPKVPSIAMSNHQSFWENMFMGLLIPRQSWVIKKELLNIPFFGTGLATLDPIVVDRRVDTSVRQILEKGQKKLKSGLWIVFFPEATRLKPHEYKKFKPSGVKLAIASKVPIVLIAHNSGLFWPKGLWIKKPGTITVKIIKTIYPEEFEGKDVRDLTNEIEEIINKNKDELAKEV